MKKLNKEATRICCRLLEKLGNCDYVKLMSDEFMPLNIERLETNIQTVFGAGTTYSFAHYYEQNGDLMSDPQMVFIVVDNRKLEDDLDAIAVYPQSYQLDGLGLYEECVSIENGKVASFIRTMQAGHAVFAGQWFRNLRQQGFLKCNN